MTFPTSIRNTYRKDFVRCATLARYLHEDAGPPKKSVDLHAGIAFAKGVEVARRAYYAVGTSVSNAVDEGRMALEREYGDFPCPPDSPKTVAAMAGALYYYFEQWPLDAHDALRPATLPNGDLAVEIHFSYPMPMCPHPDTREPLLYEGRLDMLAEDAVGNIWVVDEKTTKSLGPKWRNQWFLDAGLTGYVDYARRIFGDRVVGAIVRGIAIKKHDYAKEEVPVLIPPWMCDRWRAQMTRDVQNWASMHRSGLYDMALDHLCALYNNPCPFLNVCTSRDSKRALDQLRLASTSDSQTTEHHK